MTAGTGIFSVTVGTLIRAFNFLSDLPVFLLYRK